MNFTEILNAAKVVKDRIEKDGEINIRRQTSIKFNVSLIRTACS